MGAFRLEVGNDGVATLTFDLPERKANIFRREVLAELDELVARLAARTDIRMLVLRSAKPDIFIAGADVDEIAGVTDPEVAAEGSRYGHRLFAAWEALPFPTVAGIRGTCLGGGTELSLASTWIVASDRPDLRIGLPEVQLGIVPGWGGCVRLPRRVGLVAALELIVQAKSVAGRRALALGLADAVLPDAGFDARLLDWARARLGARRRRRRPNGLDWLLERNALGRRLVVAQAKRQALTKTRGHYPAPLRAIEVIAAGVARGAAAGFRAEARAIGELAVSPVAKSLIHVFRLIERGKRDGDDAPAAELRRPAVVGAGVMGGAIAALLAERAGLPVRLKDVRPEALSTALAHAAAQFRKRVERRRMTPAEGRARLALLQPTLADDGLAGCDLVIEAIVENLDVKRRVFGELGRLLPPPAVLATNTSSLSIDAIGETTPGRERVVGMHFFHPVDRMPLVEVVAGPRSDAASVRAVVALSRRLGKTPVVVRDGPGFLVNRLLGFYSAEALWLLDEGHSVETIDRAMVDWGMPMGPLRLADEVGLDVSAKVGHILHDAFGDRLPFPAWLDRLPAGGRLGVKSGQGIYRYAGRRERGVDPAVYAEAGLPAPERRRGDRGEIALRLTLPMVNEAARCLDEGIVDAPETLDLAMIFGTGFPPFRGGLCRWADGLGLGVAVERLERLAATVGERHRPSDALRRFASAGGFYAA
ncbi:MAG: 3-hydroxyacyl-CoA dehydrogenase NAD-binding domain-containing protein [Thermoanaerobaculia bacterium]|nr:3-hydroxyacyl-CoA dehydrogenase NAD-binding domain-containing protein [Thermoanaerobaculia bacterium]